MPIGLCCGKLSLLDKKGVYRDSLAKRFKLIRAGLKVENLIRTLFHAVNFHVGFLADVG